MPNLKKVLLFCQNENQRMEISFVLRTSCGYRVLGGVSSQPPIPDTALIVHDRESHSATFAYLVDEKLPETSILVIGAGHMCRIYPGRAMFFEPESNTQLVARLKLAVCHKRGPRKDRSIAVAMSDCGAIA